MKTTPNIWNNKMQRPLSKKENLSKFFNDKKNISDRVTKYENSQGVSTQLFTNQNENNNDIIRFEHDTEKTLPSLDFMDFTKDKSLNSFSRPRKLTLRNNNAFRSKTLSHNVLTERNFKKKSKIFLKSCKNRPKKIKKIKTFNGVPMEFMEAMKLDLKSNIIKANKYMIKEKHKLIKENPNLKYFYLCENKKNREKDEEMKRAYEYRMRFNKKKKIKNTIGEYNLNDYYTKLLLKENEQHFNINRPMIERSKFNKKYLMLQNEIEEEKKVHPNKDIRVIFSKLLCDKLMKSQEKQSVKLTKNILYKRFISSIKKSAIEFKNVKIPFNEYVFYYKNSNNLSQQLFNDDYTYLIRLIKKEKREKEKEEEKDNNVADYIDKHKFCIYNIDFFGKNILMLVVKYNLYKSIAKIMQNGGNADIQDFKGRTALHWAAFNNDLISISLLLYFCANPLIKDSSNKYPLDYVNKKCDDYFAIKEILIRCGIIRKLNKYRSWKEFDVYIRRGIQFYLFDHLGREKYEAIFSYIDNPVFYYR
jgi:hypothetical protein